MDIFVQQKLLNWNLECLIEKLLIPKAYYLQSCLSFFPRLCTRLATKPFGQLFKRQERHSLMYNRLEPTWCFTWKGREKQNPSSLSWSLEWLDSFLVNGETLEQLTQNFFFFNLFVKIIFSWAI
ncbi:hypothetical protein PO909_011324, partial [Leuciscus waleckii]